MEYTELQVARLMTLQAVIECTDSDLLNLIYKIIVHSEQ